MDLFEEPSAPPTFAGSSGHKGGFHPQLLIDVNYLTSVPFFLFPR